ncbi:hypothetical protein [Paenibacillus pini]|uniref:Uncharacterized protein n=1 Tax=Paenibacillus pini JCM 16418 TaxID=1236976 RepID=W7Y968_9BACL|nr:hypothetical protein [Paenibacillus pini]GAF07530.1 hypothetical protein JCM16418_1548 [Paenibacillus pini JCM 16418]
MGENSQQMIFLSVSVILFVAACLISLRLTGQITETLHEVANVTKGQTRSVMDHSKGSKTVLYSGTEVVLMIHGNTDADLSIEVGGANFKGREDHDEEDLRNINLHTAYEIKYIRNTQGRLITISFNEVVGEAGTP